MNIRFKNYAKSNRCRKQKFKNRKHSLALEVRVRVIVNKREKKPEAETTGRQRTYRNALRPKDVRKMPLAFGRTSCGITRFGFYLFQMFLLCDFFSPSRAVHASECACLHSRMYVNILFFRPVALAVIGGCCCSWPCSPYSAQWPSAIILSVSLCCAHFIHFVRFAFQSNARTIRTEIEWPGDERCLNVMDISYRIHTRGVRILFSQNSMRFHWHT